MASKYSDPLLCLGLCIFGFYAARAVHQQLLAVVAASRVTQEEPVAELISQHTEDALKLDTLRQLADGSNQEIRTAAIKIITERASQGTTYDILLRDISGRNIKRRNKALVSLKFLSESPARHALNHYKTYKALVDCLCTLLSENKPPPSAEFETTLRYRTQPEQDALIILNRTMPHKISEALRAGVVSRWLAIYPFGGYNSSESRKREVVHRQKTEDFEDMAMRELLFTLDGYPEGRKQLRNYGLVGSAIGETDDDFDGDIAMIFGEDTAGATSLQSGTTSGRRVREESMEEQALRRRRREAMVLSEGGRPLGREDIIQREDVASDNDE